MLAVKTRNENQTETVLFEIASNNLKYLGIVLTKYVQDLYVENYKTLMAEIKHPNKWEDIL